MANNENGSTVLKRLRQLWKGTLYVGILAIYVSLLATLLIFRGWRAFLLALFLLGLAQLFRYIANDVDRLGWVLDRVDTEADADSKADASRAQQYQRRMFALLFALVQGCSLGIVYQVFALAGSFWALVALAGFAIAELLFVRIRAVNKTIAYKRARYGIKDAGPITSGPRVQRAEEAREHLDRAERKRAELDKKLATLEQLVDEGLVSEEAFREVRDRELVNWVMAADEAKRS